MRELNLHQESWDYILFSFIVAKGISSLYQSLIVMPLLINTVPDLGLFVPIWELELLSSNISAK